MPFIKKSFITEKLLPNVAIEKLINNYVQLKKAGSNYTCCCPFHHEKTPSFSVTPSKQMFYCFGCKEHGNVIDFVMKYKNLGFVEAVEEVAQFAGIEVEYDKSSSHSKDEYDRLKEYYELMDRCASLFSSCLKSAEGQVGYNYFKNNRGLSDETIQKCRLGFAPANPRYLQDAICRNPADEKKLIDLGLLVQGQYGVHAMYRNRVMIPIFDKRGRIISFGGRTMGDDKPKYMNTKETAIYRKRQELFGLYESLLANNNRPQRLVVVEGYMDVISVRQAGCSYAVASLGTATTPEQIQTMFRYTDRIVFCYDGDSAGRNAAWHALQIITPIMQEGKEISFAFLPPEHDPDSLVREKGLDAFVKFLDEAMSYPEFLVLHNSQSFNLQDPNELSIFINNSIKLIAQIPLSAVQMVCIKLLSTPSGISENQLYDMLKANKDSVKENKSEQRIISESFNDDRKAEAGEVLKTPMRKLMAFIVQQPIVVSSVYHEFSLDTFVALCKRMNVNGSSHLEGILQLISENPEITPANFIELTRGSEYEKTVRFLMDAPLNLVTTTGAELPFNDRIDYFAVLLGDVLLKPLKERAQMLKIQLSQGNPNALEEYGVIQRIIRNNQK